jgi:hypothetical protein
METSQVNQKAHTAKTIAHIIRIIGVLFFIAMAFGVMEMKYAIFAGVACMIIAPVVQKLLTPSY